MTSIGMTGRAAATAVILVGAALAVPTSASATEAHRGNCGTGHFWDIDTVGPRYYQASGGAVGAYNSSSQTSTLKYTLSITKSRTSGWTTGGGLSVKVAVAEINGNTNYTVSKSNTTGISVEHNLSVPGKRYGYITPKVEFQKFHIVKAHYGVNCKTVVDKDYGVFQAVTAKIFYSTCVGKSQCTPKP
ncbi:hypothetical protein AB0M11_24905 [Streptomyces sp. NPDC051987]|uniref:hypothetical protein n=1 Tax=Streptomyces sp. NPDC051987 TaxID=3155808 RepID=UPI003412B4E3